MSVEVDADDAEQAPRRLSASQQALAYARLLRLSNGPTAVADVWMGYSVASGTLTPSWPLLIMTAASLCFYHGGMALNDVRDAAKDLAENRNRPISSGQISLGVATWIARSLLLLGIGLAIAASTWGMGIAGQSSVLLLAIAITLYNSRIKATFFGPIVMGACRFLNVQLGVMAYAAPADLSGPLPTAPDGVGEAFGAALVIGVYIVGVTFFARNEAIGQPRLALAAACCLSLGAIGWGAASLGRPPTVTLVVWATTWAIVGLIAVRGMAAAILQPTPKNIGRGVGIAIQGLVVIDAVLAAFYAGPMAGLAILALLPVTMLLARWIPQT